MKLNAFAIDLIAKFPLGFVATVNRAGKPRASPKGTFLVLDEETVAFGEIRSPGTMANLALEPELEVNFIDQWKRKGVRIRGTAEVFSRGESEFGALIPKWHEIWGDLANRINHIVRIPVAEVKSMTTPPYDDGATEEEMIALYKQKFAEIYP
ncbi:MAG: pyridoxamine 5'-phosphate oxidase family protein [Rhizobiaceae bacterium]